MMAVRTLAARLLLTATLAGTAGCFSLSRDTPAIQRYVLSGATPLAAAPHDPAGMTLGLRRPGLAGYLATPSIIVRRGEHGIGTSEYHRWGEDLALSISRAVASHLTASAPVAAVSVAPWPVRAEHHFLVQLHVARFEGVADSALAATHGAAQLSATWEIVHPVDGRVLARGATAYRREGWRVGDHAALVTLLEDGLASLAGEVVACAQRISRTEPAPEPPLACGV
jgi:uncharacterized lipoprotein YmbA